MSSKQMAYKGSQGSKQSHTNYLEQQIKAKKKEMLKINTNSKSTSLLPIGPSIPNFGQ